MTILLIEQYPILRAGLKYFLEAEFKNILTLESESLSYLPHDETGQRPNILILGLNEQHRSESLENMKQWKKRFPDCRVILYDEGEMDVQTISNYLRIGISGYISKEASSTELGECVRIIANGGKYISSTDLLSWMFDKPRSKNRKISRAKGTVRLSNRETEIADYLADGKGTTWIARKLDRKPSTISTIKGSIYHKLSVSNALELRDCVRQMKRNKVFA
ncbi:DNA-binding NarL/FixJ family response regulator [Dyadobacter jejuensis]|uniref:DNA-binding NarL/FixJ family response regulator n=1 Tax=Dyadobacter jejuensis TaxID=1082580 RepID=A0A316AGJ5_9BACT|nr:response regulator transcription factor [Dyadobacter jejuensis]PWJ56906.1 DNA-binding NarL/FixJ family response regulator [Dyadobacter jejuensis]